MPSIIDLKKEFLKERGWYMSGMQVSTSIHQKTFDDAYKEERALEGLQPMTSPTGKIFTLKFTLADAKNAIHHQS